MVKFLLVGFGLFMLLMCFIVSVNPPEGHPLNMPTWYTMTAISFGFVVMGILAWIFEKSD